MGFPHQALPTVAIIDMITAVIASIHLGLLPLPRSMTLQGQSLLNAFFSRLQGATPVFISHRIVIEHAHPKKLLFWMLVLCIVRCLVILLVWTSIKEGIENGRVRNRSEDYSGRAILYSIVCVLSVLLNLSNLNTLFQTRGAPPDASLKTVLLHMSASSLAAEQLIISGIEWLLFVIVAGTHGLSGSEGIDANSTTQAAITNSEPASDEVVQTTEQDKTTEVEIAPTESGIQKPKKDYGSLTESQPHAETEIEQNGESGLTKNSPSNDGPLASSSTTSNGDSPDPSAMSSDIVDIPTDRKASMQGAKERLNRARENGKVRRRSLWKKIRGKGGEETPPEVPQVPQVV